MIKPGENNWFSGCIGATQCVKQGFDLIIENQNAEKYIAEKLMRSEKYMAEKFIRQIKKKGRFKWKKISKC